MKILNKLFTRALLLTSLSTLIIFTTPVMAEAGSVNHSGQASKHSALALSHGAASTAKVASAVVATPILVAGSASVAVGSSALVLGSAISTSGESISVHSHTSGPLEVTDMIITADPAPNAAIERQNHANNTTVITTTSESKVTKHRSTKIQVKQ